jgi:hypothetical protein
MKITKDLFEKSFFSIGGGYDIEPLLRFSHICNLFINTNLDLEKNDVIQWYDGAFKKCNDIEVIEKIIIENFDERLFFELNENYVQHLTRPDFISMENLHDYRNTFNEFINIKQFAVIYRLRRRSLNRDLTFYFCSTEGLASYLVLSQNGRFSPYVLSTIQTGVLEQPNGILNSLFENKSKKRPALWIRGFEPCSISNKQYNNALASIGIYSKKAIDFNSKWYCGWSYRPKQKSRDRYCKGFIHDDYYAELNKTTLKAHFISDNHQFKFEHLTLNNSTIKDIDCIVISRKTSLNSHNINCNLVYWEDFTSNHSRWEIHCANEQLESLSRALPSLHLKNDAILHIIPFCLEDEGVSYFNSINRLKHNTITYLPNVFDFIDLKNIPNSV